MVAAPPLKTLFPAPLRQPSPVPTSIDAIVLRVSDPDFAGARTDGHTLRVTHDIVGAQSGAEHLDGGGIVGRVDDAIKDGDATLAHVTDVNAIIGIDGDMAWDIESVISFGACGGDEIALSEDSGSGLSVRKFTSARGPPEKEEPIQC